MKEQNTTGRLQMGARTVGHCLAAKDSRPDLSLSVLRLLTYRPQRTNTKLANMAQRLQGVSFLDLPPEMVCNVLAFVSILHAYHTFESLLTACRSAPRELVPLTKRT